MATGAAATTALPGELSGELRGPPFTTAAAAVLAVQRVVILVRVLAINVIAHSRAVPC